MLPFTLVVPSSSDSQSLFAEDILSVVGNPEDKNNLLSVTFQYVLVTLVALPGYYLAVCFLDKMGRKNIQIMGFVAMSLLFLIMGFVYGPIRANPGVFLVMYALVRHFVTLCIALLGPFKAHLPLLPPLPHPASALPQTFLFSNFGPNTTTFLLPTEVFPTQLRATLHGLAAASGKLGALVGGLMLTPLKNINVVWVFRVCGGVGVLGLLLTIFFLNEPRDSLSVMDAEWNDYLTKELSLDELTVNTPDSAIAALISDDGPSESLLIHSSINDGDDNDDDSI